LGEGRTTSQGKKERYSREVTNPEEEKKKKWALMRLGSRTSQREGGISTSRQSQSHGPGRRRPKTVQKTKDFGFLARKEEKAKDCILDRIPRGISA